VDLTQPTPHIRTPAVTFAPEAISYLHKTYTLFKCGVVWYVL
jgi:hypothetical protein